MRWISLALLVVSRVASATGDPTIDAADVAFGIVDNGQSAVRYINIANTDSAPPTPLVVTGATFGNNSDGWFSFAGNGCAGQTTPCTLAPPLSITTSAQLVAIRCAPPASSTGTRIATVTFASNSADTTHATSTISCTSGGGELAVTPASHLLDFGPVDLDHVPVAVTSLVRIRNIGSATITTAAGSPTGAGVARFGFTSLAGRAIAPGGHYDITVTYTPIAERTAVSPDIADLVVPVTGAIGASVVDISLRGHGVDRHAMLTSVPMFDDSFVNPGPEAQALPIVITNTGGAVLGLYDATITGSPTWTLVNADPVDVPGGTPYSFLVQFSPSAVGLAPGATFSVSTSDSATPVITAAVTGRGKLRDVAAAATVVDLGYVAVGTTARISDGTRGDLLLLDNRDLDHAFDVRAIVALGGDDAFSVVNATNIPLAAGAELGFDVAFAPKHEGAHEATAYVYLDSNPVPQATVTLRGSGVFAEVQGGGGCTTSRNGAGLGGLVIVLAVVLRRRVGGAHVFALLGLALATATADADTRNLDLAIFDPTPSTTPAFQLQGAEVGREGDWAATALVTYANDPLVLATPPNANVAIQDRMTLQLGGVFAFGDRFETGARMPLYLQNGENLNGPTMFGEPPPAGTVRGDLTLHAKARLWRHHGASGAVSIATAVALGLPTASNEQFAGSGKPEVRALALGTFTPAGLDHRLVATINAGTVLRTTAAWHDVSQGNALIWGLGASYRLRPDLTVASELFGELVPGGRRDPMGATRVLDTIEGLAGLHYQLDRRVTLGVALGRGLTSGIGAPALRGVLLVTFTPTAAPQLGSARIAGDSDGDGIPNDVDRCPDQPEDKDGFEDDDGCPDPDNDGDDILDAKDRCPNVAEDKDGFEDEDGCPDPDNDHDGIPDRFDHCPNVPETINGIDDDDGCPDAGERLVTLQKDRLMLGEAPQFTATGKLAPASANLMGQLGATLRARTELIKIRIAAHAKAAHAQTVVDWLVQYGIAADRLEASSVVDANAPADETIDVIVVDRY